MLNFIKKIKPSYVVGASIFGTNLINCKKSPMYIDEDSWYQLSIISLIKGTIYGFAWPVSGAGIVLSACSSNDRFNRHFIPGSTLHLQIEADSIEIKKEESKEDN